MTSLFTKLCNALIVARHGDRGAVAAEYGVLIAGIVVAVSFAALALGSRISALFDSVLP